MRCSDNLQVINAVAFLCYQFKHTSHRMTLWNILNSQQLLPGEFTEIIRSRMFLVATLSLYIEEILYKINYHILPSVWIYIRTNKKLIVKCLLVAELAIENRPPAKVFARSFNINHSKDYLLIIKNWLDVPTIIGSVDLFRTFAGGLILILASELRVLQPLPSK